MSCNEWKSVKLNDLTTDGKGHYGIGASAVDYDENLLTYLRITDITDDGRLNKKCMKSVRDEDAKNYLLKKNDIVFARTGNSTGRSYFYDEKDGELVFAGFLIRFNLDPSKVNPKYIKYYTLTDEYKNWIESFATGSTRKNINAKMYGDMEISIPPRNIQDSIVGIMDSLDDKIELNNDMNKTLEDMAQSIFKRWFVDFEFPNDDGEPYKSSGGEMVESELGMIPKGWESKKISELIEIKDGTHASPKVAKEGYPLVTSKHIKGNRILLEDAKLISEQDYIEVNKRSKVDTGDILISMIGTVGLTYLVQEEDINFAIKNIGLFKTSQKPLLSEYTYLYLKSKNMKNYIESRLAGTTQKYISLGELRKIAIILPNDSIMNKFKQVVGILLDKKRTSTIENEELTLIRDSILPKIMSGEIKLN